MLVLFRERKKRERFRERTPVRDTAAKEQY